jgi:hypothetical protein
MLAISHLPVLTSNYLPALLLKRRGRGTVVIVIVTAATAAATAQKMTYIYVLCVRRRIHLQELSRLIGYNVKIVMTGPTLFALYLYMWRMMLTGCVKSANECKAGLFFLNTYIIPECVLCITYILSNCFLDMHMKLYIFYFINNTLLFI